ncbi:MAG: VWA domain-containing protein [Planctomycetia bacterium]|nr:VWA domain-containing protein [Planctomycetia bacterium]
MSFFFSCPYCFVFIFVLVPLFLYWKKRLTSDSAWRGGVILLLRVSTVCLIIFALSGPIVTWKNYTEYLVFAVDRSGSVAAPEEAAENFIEESVKTQGKHKTATIFFARNISSDMMQCDSSATNLSSAMIAAAALAPEDYVPRMVLFSDGTSSGGTDLEKVSEEVSMDMVFWPTLPAEQKREMWIEKVTVPPTGYEGQVVGVDAYIHMVGVNSLEAGNSAEGNLGVRKQEEGGSKTGNQDAEGLAGGVGEKVTQGNIQLFRNGELVDAQAVTFEKDGVRGVRFQAAVTGTEGEPENDTQAKKREVVRWDIRLHPEKSEDDVSEENNAFTVFTQIIPHERILLVQRTANLGQKLKESLEKEFIEVEMVMPDAIPRTRSALQKYGLVIFVNIPAGMVSAECMSALDAYVREDGGGFIVVGGDQAFTSGGYHETQLEELLPVVCKEAREKTRKELALVLVVDRSESMKEGNAISLAREAVKKAIGQLFPQDQVGVLAYADNTVWVVPLLPLTEENKEDAFRNIDLLEAMNTTNIAPALEKAFLALREASADRKHIILMSDGISNPGDFSGIAQKIRLAGISISTVALGNEADPDLLRDLALIGGGNSYVCTEAVDLPQIFMEETAAAAAKLGIIEGKTPLRQISSIPGFMNFDFTKMPALLGYVQTHAKADSRVIFESPDADPILVWWKCGRGKTVAFTSDMESHWVETWRTGWKSFDRFWARLVNHAMKKDTSDGILQITYEDNVMQVLLTVSPDFLPEGEIKMHLEAKEERLEKEGEKEMPVVEERKVVLMRNVAPGRYMAQVKVDFQKYYDLKLIARASGRDYVWRTGTVANFTEEYRPDKKFKVEENLRQISEETGGKVNPQASDIFAEKNGKEEGRYVMQTLPFWPYLLLLSLFIWMGEIFMRRWPI